MSTTHGMLMGMRKLLDRLFGPKRCRACSLRGHGCIGMCKEVPTLYGLPVTISDKVRPGDIVIIPNPCADLPAPDVLHGPKCHCIKCQREDVLLQLEHMRGESKWPEGTDPDAGPMLPW